MDPSTRIPYSFGHFGYLYFRFLWPPPERVQFFRFVGPYIWSRFWYIQAFLLIRSVVIRNNRWPSWAECFQTPSKLGDGRRRKGETTIGQQVVRPWWTLSPRDLKNRHYTVSSIKSLRFRWAKLVRDRSENEASAILGITDCENQQSNYFVDLNTTCRILEKAPKLSLHHCSYTKQL